MLSHTAHLPIDARDILDSDEISYFDGLDLLDIDSPFEEDNEGEDK